ncbi:50S ribosomal protein L22 [Patescibacteria group bacterium]|nr:50S ribosomal protein L22 [Patescibacteria group bacterium]MBU1922181.1 50S ribosomal protein L22 [Patescibacteria group bacterium]
MEVKAKARFLRTSPKKIRLVIDMVRGERVAKALEQLKFSKKAAKFPVIKLLNSAIANAEHNFNLKRDNLLIKKITADGGPVLKRWRARAMGRGAGIKKRSTHLTIVLDEIEASVDKVKKTKKTKVLKVAGEKKSSPETKFKKSADN